MFATRQEFVIAGYVPSTTSRKAIGSLVMGVYNGKKLEHVGRVGTGYSTSVAEDLLPQARTHSCAGKPLC